MNQEELRLETMAGNKFASTFQRRNHKIVVVLVYVLLEWALIALLFINAFISFFISRFASYFGLKPPCTLCTRVDRILDPGRSGGSAAGDYRELFCDRHAGEISRLGFCSAHRRLADSGEMCEDCGGGDRTVALLSWMQRSEGGDGDLRCSCCDSSLESGFYSSYLSLKPSWGAMEEENQKGGSMVVIEDVVPVLSSDHENSDFEADKEIRSSIQQSPKKMIEERCSVPVVELLIDPATLRSCSDSSGFPSITRMSSIQQSPKDLVEVIDSSPERCLVPVELPIDPAALRSCSDSSEVEEDDNGDAGCSSEHPHLASVVASGIIDSSIAAAAEVSEECSSSSLRKEYTFEGNDSGELQDVEIGSFSLTECHEEAQGMLAELEEYERAAAEFDANCEVSIGSEICEPEQICDGGGHGRSSHDCNEEAIGVDTDELIEVHEDIELETQTYIERIHAIHKRFMFDRRESGTESLDGSVSGDDAGGGEHPLTVERLQSALNSEREASNALYAELEEERSASAVAANQTMAMITRLQEEKAAVQMEAFQYQRMMEEQSEYDQSALQLLNELMARREEERRELEKELELYRVKVLLYEAREKMKTRKSKTGASSAASSSAEESDDLSVEYSDDSGGEFRCLRNGSDTNDAESLVVLHECLAEFEEERLSILEQLKGLEERLCTIDDDERIDSFSEENGDGSDEPYGFACLEQNGHVDDFHGDDSSADENNHFGYRIAGHKGKKSLLPIFDAGADASPPKLQKKLSVAEEVVNVCGRLQSLEADREFLKHCIGSLKKGDKGMGMLREILGHLRDLRARNADDTLAS